MAERTWLIPLIVVVIVLLAGGGALGYVALKERPAPSSGPTTVALGSNVTVNYIGVFGSGPEQGRIFDTSIYSIATNPAYPKALEFSLHGPTAANYTPLAVTVSGSAPQAGYTHGNLTFIPVVAGFWQGIVGMEPNTTRVVSFPAALGYGPTDTACVVTRPLVQQVPALVTESGVNFQASFPGITATIGQEFTDPVYGWTDQILNANASFVTLQRLPYLDQTTNLSGWPVMVTGIQQNTNGTGVITVQNEIAPDQAGHLLGKDYLSTGPCQSSSHGKFIVTAVDPVAGTFTENYNSEVQGQTLVFTITVLDYFP